MNTVYALIDPRTSEAKYIGLTRLRLDKRLNGHLSTGASVAVSKWVEELSIFNIKPEILSVEENVSEADANEAETFWINYMKVLGAKLLNVQKESQGRRTYFGPLNPVEKVLKTNNHGGARKGAGGPKGQQKEEIANFKIEVRMTVEEKSFVKEKADALRMTVSEYVKMHCIS